LQNVHKRTKERLNLQSEKSRNCYDRRARQIHFEADEEVWFLNPRRIKGRTPKLQSNWEDPYKIIRKLSHVVFEIQKSSRHRKKVVHADRLAPFHRRQKLT